MLSNQSKVFSGSSLVSLLPQTRHNRRFWAKCPRYPILLDHLRAIDKIRLAEPLGTLAAEEQQEICDVLQEMFAF